jgi:hypothetical protein
MVKVIRYAAAAAAVWGVSAAAAVAGVVAPAPVLGAGPAGLALLSVAGAGYLAVRAYRKRR